MIFKFVNEEKDCQVNKSLTVYPIKHSFQDLHDLDNNIEIFTDDYHELATSTHLVFINDIVVDNWLKQYLLPLYRQIDTAFVENHVNMDVNKGLQHNFTQLQDQLLMLNLPINFKQNFELNLSLLKYLKLDNDTVNTPFEQFSNLLRIHQFVYQNRLLLLNHLSDYDLVNKDTIQLVSDLKLNVIALTRQK